MACDVLVISDLVINVHYQVKEQKPDTWKKLSAPAEASPEPGNMGVVMQRSYHLNDEDETEVEKDDLAKGSCERKQIQFDWNRICLV